MERVTRCMPLVCLVFAFGLYVIGMLWIAQPYFYTHVGMLMIAGSIALLAAAHASQKQGKADSKVP